MKKKDYELIAGIIRDAVENNALIFGSVKPYEVLEYVCESFEIKLPKDNPRFDINKFRTACGFKPYSKESLR